MFTIAAYIRSWAHRMATHMTIPAKDVPTAIREWVKATLGVAIQSYKVYQDEKFNVDMPWHEADREYYQLFKLTDNGAEKSSMNFMRSGLEGDGTPGTGPKMEGSSEVPDGFVMVVAGTYPKRAEIYTGKGAQKLLPDTSIEVSDDELAILYWAQSLKSFARPVFKDNAPYDSLLQKKLLNKQRAITIDGKNILQKEKQRLLDMQKKVQEKGFMSYYKEQGDYLKNYNSATFGNVY
jgi:hypothetical protein